jgi:hypothetical protein
VASSSEDVPVTTEFDRAATAKAIAAVDVSPCFDKPPILEAQLHVTITVMPNGRLDPSADAPYNGTEAGNCAVALFRNVRVPAWAGVPKQMGRTIPRSPVKGSSGDPPFDPSSVRSAVAAQDLSECADAWGTAMRGRAMIKVKPNGAVDNVILDPPLGGSLRGDCVSRALKGMAFRPYSGEPAPAVPVDVEVQRKK